jgi:hypothetical protein
MTWRMSVTFHRHFQKQWEDSVVTLASTQEIYLIKIVISLLIQAATRVSFIHYSLSQ